MDRMRLAADERADIATFLEGLTVDQWELPTACPGWSVRDVAAHLIGYDVAGITGTARDLVRGRLSVDRTNDIGVERARALGVEEIVQQVRAHLRPSGLTAGFRGGIALTDGLIHHQDMRRAVGLPRRVPAERLLQALPFALRAPTLPGRRLGRGLSFVATDLGWRTGHGPEVRGPGEAVLMAVAGRREALAELDGEGRERLAARVR